MSDTDPDLLVFNGLDATTGEYLLPPLAPAQVSALAQGHALGDHELAELKNRAFEINNPHAGVEADARDLAETGWGVIFSRDAGPEIRDALQPLLDLRQTQAGERFKVFPGPDCFQPEDTKESWLVRHKMGPGRVNPDKVPYYLLIVGDPAAIPFRFQYQLDVQYAVGRIHFDTVEEYAWYARSVVEAETKPALPARLAFFAAANPHDVATNASAGLLVEPLAQGIVEQQPKWQEAAKKSGRALPAWQVQVIRGEQATRARLSELLHGGEAPALFFSATHGAGFPCDDERQLHRQGALVCQDWPGPQMWKGPLSEDFYFAADHLSSDAKLLGSLFFFFACYGAGTPQEDGFAAQAWPGQPERRRIAPHDFLAGLPRRMLGLPRGGALAVVGHVDRASVASFSWNKAGAQTQVFQDCFTRLIKGGYPLGYAMEVFNDRYAEISSELNEELSELRLGFRKPDDRYLASMWTASNDSRNYILIGDPAVRPTLG